MKKKSTVKKSKEAKILSDDEFDELFQKSDFSEYAQFAKVVKVKGRPVVGPKISMHFPSDLIDQLKTVADTKSIGYQTLIRMIVKENLHKYENKSGAIAA